MNQNTETSMSIDALLAMSLEDSEAIQEKRTHHLRTRELSIPVPIRLDAVSIKHLRKELDVSHAVLVQILGLSAKTAIAWENGFSRPTKMASQFIRKVREINKMPNHNELLGF